MLAVSISFIKQITLSSLNLLFVREPLVILERLELQFKKINLGALNFSTSLIQYYINLQPAICFNLLN